MAAEVGEVEAADLIIHIGTGLMDVVAQDLPQGRLQQVAGGVVAHDGSCGGLSIHGGGDGHRPFGRCRDVTVPTWMKWPEPDFAWYRRP